MSPTLFRYIFWDLIKFFGLTSGALAGIMSFGGLLRPLTQHGLDASQVGRMLTYFMPAMSTYSLPIAALFATTMVYGRLSADNELTAMRAGGISFLSIATPALLLGLVVAIASLLLLCFVVPTFTLRVERVIYSNLAQLIANSIERTHEVRFGEANVFAQSAYVPERDLKHPELQCVVLVGPSIVSYENGDRNDPKSHVPKEFWMAQQATVYITQDEKEDQAQLDAVLQGGIRFPRKFQGGVQAGVEETQFGPQLLPPLIKENTKFMDIRRLKELYVERGKSQRVKLAVHEFIRADQRAEFLKRAIVALNGPDASYTLKSGQDSYTIVHGPVGAIQRSGELILSSSQPSEREVNFREERNGQPNVTANATEIRLRARPDKDSTRMLVDVELYDAAIKTGDVVTPRKSFVRNFVVDMPEDIAAYRSRTAHHYVSGTLLSAADRARLRREWVVVGNDVLSEMHSRASFAVSCLILVMVGCALGMMFRSGNFLSAFAVSVVPAMLSIMLIVTGQHTCENVPFNNVAMNNPLGLGLALIWSGNFAVLAIAAVLLGRLQRQ